VLVQSLEAGIGEAFTSFFAMTKVGKGLIMALLYGSPLMTAHVGTSGPLSWLWGAMLLFGSSTVCMPAGRAARRNCSQYADHG
jgi:hypothetical protein